MGRTASIPIFNDAKNTEQVCFWCPIPQRDQGIRKGGGEHGQAHGQPPTGPGPGAPTNFPRAPTESLKVKRRVPLYRLSDLGREKHLKAKIGRMRLSKSWRDLGDLKRELLDLWTEERTTYAKEVMLDIEAQRREAAR